MHRGRKDAHLSPISGTGWLGLGLGFRVRVSVRLGHAGNPPGSAEKARSLGVQCRAKTA